MAQSNPPLALTNLEKTDILSGYMVNFFQHHLAAVTREDSPENQDFQVSSQPITPSEIGIELVVESQNIVKELVKAYLNNCKYPRVLVDIYIYTFIDSMQYSIEYYVDELCRGVDEQKLKTKWPPLSTRDLNTRITIAKNTVIMDKD